MNPVVQFEIHADDPDRARKFYRSSLGWTFEAVPGMEYFQLTGGGEGGPSGGMMPRRGGPDAKPLRAFVCTVAVEDLDASLEAVEEAGGTVVNPPSTIPGVGRFAHIRDTEGNVVGLLQGEA